MSTLPTFQHCARFWPLSILLFIALLYFAHPDICMSRLSPFHRETVVDPQGSRKALPHPISVALVHYAANKITPQQTLDEMMVTANILSRRGPSNFLVYGLGFDSPLWQALNYGGRTVFLEQDPSWIARMVKAHPSLETYAVNYTTVLSEAHELLAYARAHREICSPKQNWWQSDCKLVLKTLAEQLYGIKWDVIMIDAPKGFAPGLPGRMSVIYTSAMMARTAARGQSTDILVHNAYRPVEKMYSTEFLCLRNRVAAVSNLWHFQVFGEGTSPKVDFCRTLSDVPV